MNKKEDVLIFSSYNLDKNFETEFRRILDKLSKKEYVVNYNYNGNPSSRNYKNVVEMYTFTLDGYGFEDDNKIDFFEGFIRKSVDYDRKNSKNIECYTITIDYPNIPDDEDKKPEKRSERIIDILFDLIFEHFDININKEQGVKRRYVQ
jgi:hypothetical protein